VADSRSLHRGLHGIARTARIARFGLNMRFPRGRAAVDGRTWDRSRPEGDRLDATSGDFASLLQGFLVDADGRPISLSTTGFHSAFGQIRDKLGGSTAVRELALAVLRELVGR
jgi:hypothetical protein